MSTILAVNARAFPSQMPGAPTAVLLAVLVKRVEGQIVYAAIIPDDSRADPHYLRSRDWVHKHGDKLSLVEARLNFPIDPADGKYLK